MPTQALTGREPHKYVKGIYTNHGFTVIDLMIAITVVAIITSLAMPSYRTILEKRQVTSGAEQLSAFLSVVQSESVERNENITVTYSRSSVDSWCVGFRPGTDPPDDPCDCTVTDVSDASACLVDGQLRVFSNTDLRHPDIMNAMIGDGAFAYDPGRGLMLEHTDKATLELLSPDEHNYALNVEVTATGRVKICSKDDARNVPGYAICS